MTLISPSQSAAGETIEHTDINNPVNQIAAVVNGNLDDSNIASLSGTKITPATVDTAQLKDASVTLAKLSTTAGELGGTWTSWTPTFTPSGGSATFGNSAMTGGYMKHGKVMTFWAKVILGSTANFTGLTGVNCSLPAASSANWNSIQNVFGFGTARLTGSYYPTSAYMATTTSIRLICFNAGGSYLAASDISATAPGAWNVGDSLFISGTYEVA